MLTFLLLGVLGYVLGSIPGGYIVGKGLKGIDVRKYGSGNIGATNVLRVIGKGPAFLAFLIDFGKGVAAILIAEIFSPQAAPLITKSIAGLACICGHNWSFFLKFRGGKGVATSAGVFLVLTPLPFVFALLTMIAVVGITKYVSLGSIISASTLPFYIWTFMGKEHLTYSFLACIVAALIIFRHSSNLKRLLSGEEHKLGEKVKTT